MTVPPTIWVIDEFGNMRAWTYRSATLDNKWRGKCDRNNRFHRLGTVLRAVWSMDVWRTSFVPTR